MNRLAAASSPYLQQHADNPVHWREWGAEAMREAERRDVPILLSVGYAACHWCHVMAHESFEDEATAAVMNEGFVNVKVDREERPDVDQIYMNALHALGEQGGWPLTMFLDPQGQPFWGGTYFPPEPRYGRPSFVQMLEAVRKTWREDRERIRNNTRGLSEHLRRESAAPQQGEPTIEAVDAFAETVLDVMDRERGGLRGAPKFPNAPMMEALWRAWLRTGRDAYRDAFVLTLRAQAQGGIYDHVGGGLHRYAVDARWLMPHFEKMLYDQAHFIRQCGWTHAATGDDLFRRRVDRTVRWLRDEMESPRGMIASLDADTPTPEGNVEGLTYTWTPDEIRAVLGEKAEAVIEAYDLGEPNFEGRSIPNRIGHDGDPPLADALQSLRRARQDRVQPAPDEKVLTDWNGALAAARIDTARLLGGGVEGLGAETLIDDVRRDEAGEITPPARLHHSQLHGPQGQGRFLRPALLSDHVEIMHASLTHYAATGRKDRLATVRDHLAEIVAHYLVDGLPVLTHDDADDLLVRPSAFQDGPDPSPASRLSQVLTILDALGEPLPDGLKDRLERALAAHLASARFGTAGAANALDHAVNVATLVLVGAPDEWDANAMGRGDPNLFVLRAASFDDLPDNHAARALEATGAPVAILCRHQACRPPARSLKELEALLAAPGTEHQAPSTP